MKTSSIAVCAAAALLLSATTTMAGGPAGQIPKETLAKMGLSGMQHVSDAQGDQIRGKQFVISPFIPVLSTFLAGGGGGATPAQSSEITQTQTIGPFGGVDFGNGFEGEIGNIFGINGANFDEQGAQNVQAAGGGNVNAIGAGDEIDVFDYGRVFSPGINFLSLGEGFEGEVGF